MIKIPSEDIKRLGNTFYNIGHIGAYMKIEKTGT